ncbi:phosphoenolpyruvate synthase [Pontibacter oryzae]|uniref:Phosphoenolpyruvate synthase n=1 Tax=Pontibacter oryzae TaxID=2304593 RepID=A0A399SFC0_9BACT|nr:phosphoenolpyruvate synthase [Pontibacter oryzae]RIJ41898.1 phosphoenolpyruvate synthase [Pontibacter oryzae]
MSELVLPFNQITNTDTSVVGGKNASLGEMIQKLTSKGIHVPDGFATTATAYRAFLGHNNLEQPLADLLNTLDTDSFSNLHEIGKQARKMVREANMPNDVVDAIKEAYEQLKASEVNLTAVAVRSSATAEDLPEASFAGQHDSFLNVQGAEEVMRACQKCFISLFNDRAIKYRADNGFEHMKVALSAGVQRMVRSDKASAGVIFTIAPDSGLNTVLFMTGSWGLGENVVQGAVNADEFYVFKDAIRQQKKAIVSKKLGTKEMTMVYATDAPANQNEKTGEGSAAAEAGENLNTTNISTPKDKQEQWVLNDNEITTLAAWALQIEEHYTKPMDIEWAKDGESGELFIVQARPETVHSGKSITCLKSYHLTSEGQVIARGNGVGGKIAAGKARLLHSPKEIDKLQQGDVLVTGITNPDWDPVLKKASAIVTDSGGRTSHAAIVAREVGAVAVVGTGNGTQSIKDGQEVTVSCAEGEEGKVYEGILAWEEHNMELDKLGQTKTQAMLILGDPEQAFFYAMYPVAGVGLMRLEFVINNSIKAHPLALIHLQDLEDHETKAQLEQLTKNYESPSAYFVEKLSQAVATTAAAFFPRDVIVRMSDFKSNEYANLLGGQQFEPHEENPMLGFRGASRYYHEKYMEGFKLECQAMRVVRDEMGLTNVKLMIPFCRTTEEAARIKELMAEQGLTQGENGLELYMMVEVPSNVILLDQFAEIFDGFSIGSNDLTQLTLGIDRDSSTISELFNERDPAAEKMIAMAIAGAKRNNKKIGLCGQAPSDFPEVTKFLVEQGIDSISFNPDAIAQGIQNILKAERQT